MEVLVSFCVGVAIGVVSNYLWNKVQTRRKDSHITVEVDGAGFRFSGRFNADATKNDPGTKNFLNVINDTVNKD